MAINVHFTDASISNADGTVIAGTRRAYLIKTGPHSDGGHPESDPRHSFKFAKTTNVRSKGANLRWNSPRKRFTGPNDSTTERHDFLSAIRYSDIQLSDRMVELDNMLTNLFSQGNEDVLYSFSTERRVTTVGTCAGGGENHHDIPQILSCDSWRPSLLRLIYVQSGLQLNLEAVARLEWADRLSTSKSLRGSAKTLISERICVRNPFCVLHCVQDAAQCVRRVVAVSRESNFSQIASTSCLPPCSHCSRKCPCSPHSSLCWIDGEDRIRLQTTNSSRTSVPVHFNRGNNTKVNSNNQPRQ